MTTVMIDDELGRLVGEAARARGKTLEEFAAEALRRVIRENGGVRRVLRNGIPVMLVADEQAAIDPEKIRQVWRRKDCDRLAGREPAGGFGLEVSDATLLRLARTHGAKLVTFDKPVAGICPWRENLETLIP